ncbi:MAG: flagellar basal body P-ring formation chaperone FlgA [bacterium]
MLKKFIFIFILLFIFLSPPETKASFAATGGGLTAISISNQNLRKMVIRTYLKKVPLKFRKYFHFNDFVFNVPFKNIKIYSVQIEINNPGFSGYNTAIIKLLDKNNGAIKGIDDITFKTEIYAPVAVASQTIGKFQIIKSGDVKISYKNIPALNDGYYLGGKGPLGREAKFFIAGDSALTNANTERKRIINFGNTVNIVYKSSGLILKTKGTALQAGALNSVIRVKNIDSGAILNCIVKSDKIVAVR